MTYKKKLIEVALPLAKINEESSREKSIRHGHPSTLHLWWARRPLAAARAVLWSSLIDDPSAHPEKFPTETDQLNERNRLFEILERLVPWESSTDSNILDEAKQEIIRSCGPDIPLIVDPFGGGGTIPLEATRLGLKAETGDLNPVAVIIHKAMMEIPYKFVNRPPIFPGLADTRSVWMGVEGLVADIEAYGLWMRDKVRERIGNLYPNVTTGDGSTFEPIAWIWARTVQSPDPSWSGHVPLVGSWEIVKGNDRKKSVWAKPIVDHEKQTISFEIEEGGVPEKGTVVRGNGICCATGTAISNDYIKAEGLAGRLSAVPIAVVVNGGGGRKYLAPSAEIPPIDTRLMRSKLVGTMPPAGQGLGFRVQAYGFTEWHSIFLDRQIAALSEFSDSLSDIRAKVINDGKDIFKDDKKPLCDGGQELEAYSGALVTYLSFVIDRVVPRWNSLSVWNAVRETLEQVYRIQTVQMTWAFAEGNPFTDMSGGWTGQIDWVSKALLALPISDLGTSSQIDARANVARQTNCIVSTDPPYYDNIGYADLSDLFYVWLRRNLGAVWPNEFSTLLTPKAEELIADPTRAGSRALANQHFESGMLELFEQIAIKQSHDFPATIFYAFKSVENSEDGIASTGWEKFLSGLLDSGFTITATWPIRTEMKGGVRNYGRNSLASSIVLVCRQRDISATLATRQEFLNTLRSELPDALRIMREESIPPVDLAQSAIGPGISIYSRYAKVIESDGNSMTVRTALSLINGVLSEVLSGEESDMDPESRFAITWFEQYGFTRGPFGDAETLARAKNTSVQSVVDSGILENKDGVRLLTLSQLQDKWDPLKDGRLTVWEVTHYLLRALLQDESSASELLRKIGSGMGERARTLAYQMFSLADKRGSADEASDYNMLVTAWPEIQRLARQDPNSNSTPDQLF